MDDSVEFDGEELFVKFWPRPTCPACKEDKEAEGLGVAEEHGERLGDGRGKS